MKDNSVLMMKIMEDLKMAAKKVVNEENVVVSVETKEVEGTVTTVTEVPAEKVGLGTKVKNGLKKAKESKVVKTLGVAAVAVVGGVIGYALGTKGEASDAEVLQYFELNEVDSSTEE